MFKRHKDAKKDSKPAATLSDSPQENLQRLNTSTDATGLYMDFTTELVTTTNGIVTVITQQPIHDQSVQPSISWRIPTITTNQLPWTASNVVTDSLLPFSAYPSLRSNRSAAGGTSSARNTVSELLGYLHPTTTSTSSTKPTHNTVATTSTSSSSSSSSSTSADLTTTVTHYYEDLTYTQMFVVTNEYTSLTTGILETTSFYAEDLSATYEISPPAITTDAASFKALYNMDFSMASSSSNLTKGQTAGISVGIILGVLALLIGIGLWLRKRINWSRFTKSNSYFNNKNHFDDDDYNEDIELGFHHRKGKVNEDDPFSYPPPRPPLSDYNHGDFDEPITPEMENTPTFDESSPEFSLHNMRSNFQSFNSSLLTPPVPPPPRNRSDSFDDQLLGLGTMIRDLSGESENPITRGGQGGGGNAFTTEPISPPRVTIGGPPDIREVLRGTPPPIRDRSMDIVYESINEHEPPSPIKRTQHARHNSSESDQIDADIPLPYYKRRGVPPSPLMLSKFDNLSEDSGSPKSPFANNESDWCRGRSGSAPRRYESLSESVQNLKQHLKNTPPIPPPSRNQNENLSSPPMVVDSIGGIRDSWGSSLTDPSV